jgi:predicted enzyme related to lactoylglutathione lyase
MQIPSPFIAAVMVHVSNVSVAMTWYERVFPNALRLHVVDPVFEYLQVGQVRIEVVPSDSKVSSGTCGSVVYWQFPDFETALHRLQEAGAILYRGPMKIENGECMCQVQDPWGNCIGIRGPSTATASFLLP